MLLLATEVWKSHGGIQRSMRMVSRILAAQEEHFALLTLLDGNDVLSRDPIGLSTTCCNGSKLRFCLELLRLARSGKGKTTIVGHAALLPLVWAFHQFGLIQRYALVIYGIEAWRRLPWISRLGARKASAIVSITRYTLREFCYQNRLDDADCLVIPLACDFQMPYVPRSSPTNEIRILTVTRLSRADAYKGVETIMLAVQRGRKSGLSLVLDLVGSGDDKARLENVARSLGISDFVQFHGSVPDEAVQRLMRESDVFVMPSKKEGFGIVFLEAMSAGLPCIGANHGGTPEVIEHGENGFLIEYGDVDQLLFYLRALMESPGMYQAMSNSARVRATQTLSLNAMAQAWGALATNVARVSRPAPPCIVE